MTVDKINTAGNLFLIQIKFYAGPTMADTVYI